MEPQDAYRVVTIDTDSAFCTIISRTYVGIRSARAAYAAMIRHHRYGTVRMYHDVGDDRYLVAVRRPDWDA